MGVKGKETLVAGEVGPPLGAIVGGVHPRLTNAFAMSEEGSLALSKSLVEICCRPRSSVRVKPPESE